MCTFPKLLLVFSYYFLSLIKIIQNFFNNLVLNILYLNFYSNECKILFQKYIF